MSPQPGELDEAVLSDLLSESPDEALALLATMTSATDRRLRDLARTLAGRIVVDVARRGSGRRRGAGRMATVAWRAGGDVDLDASIDSLVAARAARAAVAIDDLRVRDWVRPSTAWCLLVDRSGSMTGRPLATAAVAAAAVALRGPDDYSVLAFARDVVAVKAQDRREPVEGVVDDLFALRGHGTTDVAGALTAANRQLARSMARRRIVVLLSDCRATEPGDAVRAAAGLDELVILAPEHDDGEAVTLAADVGASIATVSGPSEVPEALNQLVG